MNGVVVAVQSALSRWPAPVQCQGQQLAWNLRDPTAALVATTAQLVMGLLPPSVAVDVATGQPTTDWTWAVGEQPGALTAPGFARWSAFHVDHVHRHVIAVRLDAVARTTVTATNRSVNELPEHGSVSGEGNCGLNVTPFRPFCSQNQAGVLAGHSGNTSGAAGR